MEVDKGWGRMHAGWDLPTCSGLEAVVSSSPVQLEWLEALF